MIRPLLTFVFLSVIGGHLNAQPDENAKFSREFVYVGTFTERGSLGIYVFQFHRKDGTLTTVQTVPGKASPSFIAIHPSGKYLYAVQREGTDPAKDWGTVSSYKIDQETGKLTFMNEQPSYGADPAHVSTNPTGTLVFASNYGGGSLAVYPIGKDGMIGKATDVIQQEGSSVNKARQEKSHVHSAIPSPDGQFLYVSNLGTDQIFIYKIGNNGKLTPASMPFVRTKPGSGPRHLEFSPDGDFVASAEEMGSTVSIYSYNKTTGALNFIERHSSLPKDYKGENTGADIHFDPSGKFVYASNRGDQSLAIFHFDDHTGQLSDMTTTSTMGKWPRNFLMDPEGQYVFVANRHTDNVVVFKRNQKTGALSYNGEEAIVPGAVCVKMLQLK